MTTACRHPWVDDDSGRCYDCDTRVALMDYVAPDPGVNVNLTWNLRDGVWYGYDANLPGGCHVYRDPDGVLRAKVLVNAMVVDDAVLPVPDGADVLACASNHTTDVLTVRKANL